jgi:hypothetical protein
MTEVLPANGELAWGGKINTAITDLDTRLSAAESAVTAATAAASAATTAAAAAVQTLTPDNTLKTATFTPVVGKRYSINTTGGSFAVNLPTAPVDKSIVAFRIFGGTNTFTVNAGGTATFNLLGTLLTDPLTLFSEEHTYTYNTAANTWFISVTNLLLALDARYAPLGASYKGTGYQTGDVVGSGYDIAPNGMRIIAPATLTAAQITLIYPTIGGTQVWHLILDRAGVASTIGTITIADGARGGVLNSLSTALLAGDLLFLQCFQANGATYTGMGPTLWAAFGGSLSIPTAPTIVSGLAATPGVTTVGLTWTGHADTYNYLIRRDGKPYGITSNTAYTDGGPTGSGLSPGETHTYNVDALVPGNITVNNTGVVSGPANAYTYFPSTAQNLSVLSNDFTVTLGTNAGTSVATDSSGILTMTSGAIGSNAVQDRVNYNWIKDSAVTGTPPGASHTAFTRSWEFGFGTSNAFVDMYWDGPTWTSLATSVTNFLQMEFTPTAYRIGVKAPGFNSGGFYVTTATTTSPAQATTIGNSSGFINWPITVTPDPTKAHMYGLKVDCSVISGTGTQDIKIYMGTSAQLSGGTLPLINTVTLTAAQRSALATGTHYTTLLGSPNTAVAQTYFERTLTIQPDI